MTNEQLYDEKELKSYTQNPKPNMPGTWTKTEFKNLFLEPLRNGVYKSKEFHGIGQKVVNMGELFEFNFISNQKMKRVQLNEQEKQKSLLKNGDLLFARRSLVLAGSGKCSIVKNIIEDTTFESSIIRVRLNNKLSNPLFFYYYFHSPLGRHSLVSISSQTAVSGITGSNLSNIIINFPPLEIQNNITSVISSYDDLIETNEKRVKVLEEMAQRLYTEWFVHFRFPCHEKVKLVDSGTEYGMIPEGWKVKSFYDVVENYDSKRKPISSMKRVEMKGVFPYYGAAKIIDHIDKYIFDGRYLLIAEDGSVITEEGKPTLQFVDEKFWVSNHAHIIQGKGHSTETIYLRMNNLNILPLITGAAQPKITKDNLSRVLFITPTESTKLGFEIIVRKYFDQIFNLKKQNQNLSKTRDLLILQLVTGKRPLT